MTANSDQLPPERTNWSVATVLQWHMDHGTRPPGSTKPQGEPWIKDELAATLGCDTKNIENWLTGVTPQERWVTQLVGVLFGYGKEHRLYSEELQKKCRAARAATSMPQEGRAPSNLQARTETDKTDQQAKSRSPHVQSPDMPRHRLDLVGRDDELRRIHLLLNAGPPDEADAPVAIVGLPGLGKTSLALGYAQKFKTEYDQVWWCRAESTEALVTSLSHLSRYLTPDALPEADTTAAAYDALRVLSRRPERWLLVYDNAELPSEIASLLPSTPTKLLVTSRHHAWRDWSQKFDLGPLTPEAAITLLMDQAGRKDEVGARHLAQLLGYLPLALSHAARLCEARPSLSFSVYAERATEMMTVAPVGHPYPREVHATFTIAIQEALKTHGRIAEEIMAVVASCGPDRIPETLITSAFDDQARSTSALLTLLEVSLVQSDPYPDGVPALSVHRLVQDVARERALRLGLGQAAIEHIASWLANRFRPDGDDDPTDPDSWDMYEQLRPHVAAVSSSDIIPKNPAWPEVLFLTGAYFLRRRDYAPAEIFFGLAGARNEAVHGRHHHLVARDLFHFGHAARLLEDRPAAKQRYEEALGIAFATLPPAAPLTAAIAAELGVLKALERDYVGARALLEKSLQAHRAMGGKDAMATATVLSQLGDIARAQREFDEAIRLQTEAISLAKDDVGEGHPDLLILQSNLGLCYQDAGDLDRARELLHLAMVGLQDRFGPNNANTIRVAHYLSGVLADQGKMQEACDLLRVLADLCDNIEGASYRQHSNLLQSLAGMLTAGGSAEEALPHAQKALALETRYGGPDRQQTRGAAAVLVTVLEKLGLDGEADQLRSQYSLKT